MPSTNLQTSPSESSAFQFSGTYADLARGGSRPLSYKVDDFRQALPEMRRHQTSHRRWVLLLLVGPRCPSTSPIGIRAAGSTVATQS